MGRFITTFGVTCVLGGVLAGSAAAASEGPMMTGATTQDGGVAGISAHGSLTAASGELTAAKFFHATVTCLEVTGNDGIATAVIDSRHDPSFPVGETIVAEGVDTDAVVPKNTTPGAATDLWRISFASNGGIFPDLAHPGCFLPFFPPVPIERGDVLVRPGS
jgi:hypothetical protein